MEEHPHHTTMKDVESLDNLNVQINSIGTRLEKMTLANDGLLRGSRRISKLVCNF